MQPTYMHTPPAATHPLCRSRDPVQRLCPRGVHRSRARRDVATAPLSDVAHRMSVRHTRGALNIIEQIGAGQFGVVAKAVGLFGALAAHRLV